MGFWKREDELGRELRATRPEPRRELVDGIVGRIEAGRRRGSGRPVRLGLAAALAAGMLTTLGAFGGLSYAASGVANAVDSAVHFVSPAKHLRPAAPLSSARAQYYVAYCLRGHTIQVDSHAANGMQNAGATPGPCGGSGAFLPLSKTRIACFKGHNVRIPKTSAHTRKQLLALRRVGIKLGFCKKV